MATQNAVRMFDAEIKQGWTSEPEVQFLNSLLPEPLSRPTLVAFKLALGRNTRPTPLSEEALKQLNDLGLSSQDGLATFFKQNVKIRGTTYRSELGERAKTKTMQHLCWWGEKRVAKIKQWCTLPGADPEDLWAIVQTTDVDTTSHSPLLEPFAPSNVMVRAANLGDLVAVKTICNQTYVFATTTYSHPTFGGPNFAK